MTGMPCSMASSATGVSGPPSCGRMIRASGSSAISCSTCDTWAAESLVPSSRTNSTSSNWAASSSAFSVMAASQPWSAPGALKAILTVSPSSTLPPSEPESLSEPLSDASSSSSPLSHAVSASATTASTAIHRCCRALNMVGCPPLCFPDGSPVAALQRRGGEDDHAFGQLLELGRHVEQVEQVEQQAEGDDAEERAGDGGPAPGQAGPADDDGGDGVELQQVPGDRGGAPQAAGEQHRGDPHAQARST